MPPEFAGITDVGRKRSSNEDYLLLAPRHGLLVVADGLGGLTEVTASKAAASAVASFFESQGRTEDQRERLRQSILRANANVVELNRTTPGLATTIVCAVIDGARAYVGWVGDCRAYLYRDARLEALTQDHSLVNQLVSSGQLRAEDAVTSPYRTVLLRALCAADPPEVDVIEVGLVQGDIVLLCSDGLHREIEDARIEACLSKGGSAQELARDLVALVNAEGGTDNVTVALARYRA